MTKDGKDWSPVEIEDCVGERMSDSGKALLVVFNGFNEYRAEWLPCGCIKPESEVYKADTEGTLIIPCWLAEEKGLV